jgi:hypothetical protein
MLGFPGSTQVLAWVSLPCLLVISLLVGRFLAGSLRHTPVHSFVERQLLYTVVGVTSISWLGTILAVLGQFRWWLLTGCIVALAVLTWHSSRTASPGKKQMSQTPRPVIAGVVALLVVITLLYARPAESFFLVDDSAVYTIGGVVLARTGDLFYQLDSFWRITDGFVRQFMYIGDYLLPSRHLGQFFQWFQYSPILEIGLLPLPKVWTALAAWIFGPGNATLAVPFFGVFGIAVLYGLARRLCGWPTGLAAALLLAVSLPQLWFSRYPLSEIYTQALLFGGLYLAVLARQNAEDAALARRLAVWSGLTLATLTIVRFEALLILLPIVSLLAITWQPEYWKRHGFAPRWLVSLVGASILGLAVSVGVARRYVMDTSLVTTPTVVRVGTVLILVLLVGGGWLWSQQRVRASALWLVSSGRRIVPVFFAGGWGVWAVFALWQLASRDWAQSLPGWLAQYLTLPGVLLGALGAAWLLWQQRQEITRPELVTFLGTSWLFLVLYTIDPKVNPVHPWAMRRLVPMVLPAFALGAAGLIAEGLIHLRRLPTRRSLGAVVRWGAAWGALILLGWLVLSTGERTRPLLLHKELGGFYRQAQAAAERFPTNAVLLFDNGPIGERLTQVFEFVFGRVSLALQFTPDDRPDSEVDRLIEAAQAVGRPVYLVVTDGNLTWRPDRWQLSSRGASKIETTVLRPSEGRPPQASDVVSRTLWLDIYEILPVTKATEASLPAKLPLVIPVGPGSYPFFRDGFWGWVTDDQGKAFRWSNGAGQIVAPWPAAPAVGCLEIDLAGGRSKEDEPAHLQVQVEGERLYDGVLPPGFEVQRLRIPLREIVNHELPGLEIQLLSNTWQPAGDNPLGVLVYGLQVLESSECAR